MKTLACTFTGHRPARFSFGYDECDEKCIRIKALMANQIRTLIDIGVHKFFSGIALGVDQWAASIVLDMKREYNGIHLTAVLPCETQANRWSAEQRERYFNMLAECDDVITLHTHYTKDCIFECNRYLIDNAEYLLAIYDGGSKGGTAYTVKYAEQKKRRITVIHPDTLELMSSDDIDALRRRRQFSIIKSKAEDRWR